MGPWVNAEANAAVWYITCIDNVDYVRSGCTYNLHLVIKFARPGNETSLRTPIVSLQGILVTAQLLQTCPARFTSFVVPINKHHSPPPICAGAHSTMRTCRPVPDRGSHGIPVSGRPGRPGGGPRHQGEYSEPALAPPRSQHPAAQHAGRRLWWSEALSGRPAAADRLQDRAWVAATRLKVQVSCSQQEPLL